MGFVLVFDLPRTMPVERVRIHRELVRTGARNIQHSFWRHENLRALVDVGIRIRNLGGKAEILEERFLL